MKRKRNPWYFQILKWITGILLLFLLYQYVLFFLAPVYDFPEPSPFTGERFFNPYERIDSTRWFKSNFHFHTRAWGGLTSGRHNSYEAFYFTYKALGYHAPQISNYQSIDDHFKDSSFYIPVYEHGFGVRKKHQILIGARDVLWLDYSLFQTLSHKQHILNLLRRDNEIVAIAHPDWEKGYTIDDMKYLTNYDMVESLDANWRSIPQWDAALSAGRPVWLLADDDAHDIADPYEIQRICTYINAPSAGGPGLVKALKEGRSFGTEIFMSIGETFEQKAWNALTIPVVNSVRMADDTLKVSVSGKPLRISFIGQNGEIRKVTRLSNKAWYKFRPEDTYIRTEILFLKYYRHPAVGPGTVFYLNPVFRYNGDPPSNTLLATINPLKTWFFRLVGLTGLALVFGVVWYVRRRKRNNQ